MKKSKDNANTLPSTLTAFIWHYLKDKKWHLAGFFFVALFWAIEMSLSPYLLKVIIDAVVKFSQTPSKLLSIITFPAFLYISMSFLLDLNFRLYDYINLRLHPAIKSAMQQDMFAYLLNHSHRFFQDMFAGSLTKKIFDMVEYVEQLISIPNEWFYPRFLAMLVASGTLFKVVHPMFGIILSVWAAFFIYISYMTAKKSEILSRELSEAYSVMSGALSDSISNITSTTLFANTQYEIKYVGHGVSKLVNADRRLQWRALKINFVNGLGLTVLLALMLSTLIYGSMHAWVSPGDFAFVLMLSIGFMMSVYDIGRQMLKFSKAIGRCNQSLSFIRMPPEIVDAPKAKFIHIMHGEIQFHHVTFQYNDSMPLFANLNVAIKAGEKVGLVGYSGGGKSTFIKLILRLMDVQSGSILIDNQDIKTVTQNSLRKQIATIPQEPDLFHRTIMENIRFAKTDADDEEVIQAAKQARCHEFISELPDKYQSLVGERGVKLSGGQKQRIAIARAFLKNAPILLLDEATSSLDSITERYIQESLHKVMAGKTTIVIAHRLSTLKNMDRILVFVKGNIVEDGNLNSLLENKENHFYKLWQMQAEGFIPSIME